MNTKYNSQAGGIQIIEVAVGVHVIRYGARYYEAGKGWWVRSLSNATKWTTAGLARESATALNFKLTE